MLAALSRWSRLKYHNNYHTDYHEIYYRHSWCPEDESYCTEFSTSTTTNTLNSDVNMVMFKYSITELLAWPPVSYAASQIHTTHYSSQYTATAASIQQIKPTALLIQNGNDEKPQIICNLKQLANLRTGGTGFFSSCFLVY